MRKNFLFIFFAIVAGCGDGPLEGEYKNQESTNLAARTGIYSAFEFKGKDTVVIKGMGQSFPTSYIKDGKLIRIRTDKSDLLLTVQDRRTLIGEGYAKGTYIKK